MSDAPVRNVPWLSGYLDSVDDLAGDGDVIDLRDRPAGDEPGAGGLSLEDALAIIREVNHPA